MKESITKDWEKYERGKDYNNRLRPNYYNVVNSNLAFYSGDQWINMPQNQSMSRLPKPVFNIIKRVVTVFVASLTSNSTSISFEPLAYAGLDGAETAEILNSEVANLFEKFKMDFRIREALFNGAVEGDYCAHFYWDKTKKPYGGKLGSYEGEICMELVDGVNVMFGNPNSPIVENQPYILIAGRDTVDNLRREAARYGQKPDGIRSDTDYEDQAGVSGKIELEADGGDGKALFLYKYYKKETIVEKKNADGTPVLEPKYDAEGHKIVKSTDPKTGKKEYEMQPVRERKTTVHVSKSTKTQVIFEDIDTGLTYYPVAFANWERQKNTYHGRALVTGIIPNQIYINSMFAMVMHHQKLMGFPKIIYNGDYISSWNNQIGQAISVKNLPDGMSLSQLAHTIAPADMSSQIMAAIDKAMDYTKETLGVTDAQMGAVRPDNTSAIIALQSASNVPLENPRALLYEWVEDIGRILLDMMGTYYGERPILIREPDPNEEGALRESYELFDFSSLKDVWLKVRADVGASTYWSKIAMVQTLDNLKRDGTLDIIDYLERLPAEYLPRKEELIEKMKHKAEQMEELQMAELGGQAQQKAPTSGNMESGADAEAELEELLNGLDLSPDEIQAVLTADAGE